MKSRTMALVWLGVNGLLLAAVLVSLALKILPDADAATYGLYALVSLALIMAVLGQQVAGVYESQVQYHERMEQQIGDGHPEQAEAHERDAKLAKTKRWITLGVGVAGTVALVVIYFTLKSLL